ncbi:hypothetical protein JCM10908_006224 [Rhodotorula pacifica]|uniref:uncharacterized protein n=1 Tax=Rhodotorula pacifica TaxID=1495444 RepID=UPI00317017C9
MRLFRCLAGVASLSTVITASTVDLVPVPPPSRSLPNGTQQLVAPDQSPSHDLKPHEKRLLGLCFDLFGLCLNLDLLQRDTNNCGRCCNRCGTNWAHGTGSQCVAGVCQPGRCANGYTIDYRTQSCVNLQTDTDNCGAVDNQCTAEGADSIICSSGTCVVKTCRKGLTRTTSGTCIDLQNDVSNCGAEAKQCDLEGATSQACSAGKCRATACKSPYALLDSACVNTDTDTSNCGSAGRACALEGASSQVCSSGTCQATACSSGYGLVGARCANFNTDNANCGKTGNVCQFPGGTGACIGGSCTFSSCSPPFYLVNKACKQLDIQNDPQNCGGPGKSCSYNNGVAACAGGSCSLASCVTGYKRSGSDCIKIDTASDSQNCGALNTPCIFTNGAGVCRNSNCVYTSCASGYYNLGDNKCTLLDLQTDPAHCGSTSTVCKTENGTPSCRGGQCGIATCNDGYKLSGSSCVKIDTDSDVLNCGGYGQACQFTNGGGTCQKGVCTTTSCTTKGYYLVGGLCIQLDLQTDPNHCGVLTTVCSVANGKPLCSNGVCGIASCDVGFELKTTSGFLGIGASASCEAIDTSSDARHCGSLSTVCSFTNGAGTCTKGKCTHTSCATGFYIVDNACVALDLQTDVNHCGSTTKACEVDHGTPACVGGRCQLASCETGYKPSGALACSAIDLSTDLNHCGALNVSCPTSYANGGAANCIGGICSTTCASGYAFDTQFQICRSILADLANCGAVFRRCAIPQATSQVCTNGACVAVACVSGYKPTSDGSACAVIDTQTDSDFCGSSKKQCTFTPAGAKGKCVAGVCTYTNCPKGYSIVANACVLNPSSRARHKRSITAEEALSLCPAGEQACPIAGSTTFDQAVALLQSGVELTTFLNASGGYECLDTQGSLESCGGCASTGHGQDCTLIAHAGNVGCEQGRCIVSSCRFGYIPTAAFDGCVSIASASPPSSPDGSGDGGILSAGRNHHERKRMYVRSAHSHLRSSG